MEHRRRGRPALVEGEASVGVSVRVSLTDYDRLDAQARRERVTVSDIFRRALARSQRDDDDGDE
jgi:hypothetical protein